MGNAINKEVRKKAKAALPNGFAVEKQRAANGWVWLRKGKTSRQVSPDKIEALKSEGWK